MGRDTCRMPNCDREPGSEETDSNYRESKFCSVKCDVKYDHLKSDAGDARRGTEERVETERRDLPEYDGPPY